jgi:ribosome biogenesis GTPase
MDAELTGIVIKSTGSWYQVLLANGTRAEARIKGRFRLDDIKHTNPVAVGDRVSVKQEGQSGNFIIDTIQPRSNYIIRKSSNLSKQTHIIASNMDQLLIIATLALPPTSLGFIDRILVTAEAYHIKPYIVWNKVDLYESAEERQWLDETIALYKKVGYNGLCTSSVSRQGVDELKKLLHNKTSLVIGHSGVGKSSLLNTLDPSLNLKTGELSNFHLKGKHTTTFAEMHALSFGGYIIDTPGIREFGLVDIPDEELSHYFIEMRPYIGKCRFNNCKHISEPGCAVKEALASGKISELRYQSYLSMLLKEDLYA